jgi:hypothetical protein
MSSASVCARSAMHPRGSTISRCTPAPCCVQMNCQDLEVRHASIVMHVIAVQSHAGDSRAALANPPSFRPLRPFVRHSTADDDIPVFFRPSAAGAIPEERDEQILAGHGQDGGRVSSSSNSSLIIQHLLDLKQNANFTQRMAVDPHDVQDVENMLEAYSLQADYLLAQLQALSKELDDFQVLCRLRYCSCNISNIIFVINNSS